MAARRVCACEGDTLDRLLQPAVMALLSTGPLHAYALVDRLSSSPLMKDARPDPTGVCRLLNLLEKQKLVSFKWDRSEKGPPRRVYRLTRSGRTCLRKWIKTLDEYQRAVRQLVTMMRRASSP